MPQYKSFDNSKKKLRTTWDNAEENDIQIKTNNNFTPLIINKTTLQTNKKIQIIDIEKNAFANDFVNDPEADTWFGNVELEGFTEQNLEYIYPTAFCKLGNTGIDTKQVLQSANNTLSFDYIFFKENDNKYILRYRLQCFLLNDPLLDEETILGTVQLILFNYRIYDNLQKGRG